MGNMCLVLTKTDTRCSLYLTECSQYSFLFWEKLQMAESKKKTTKPKRSTRKKPETVRQRADKAQADKNKAPRRRKISGAASKPAGKVSSFLSRSMDIHSHDEEAKTSFLTKRRSIVPSYVRGAFQEIKQVTWPTFSVAMKLTAAVFLFAFAFSFLVAGLDWLLDQAFEEIILNESQNIKDFFTDKF